MVGRMGTAVIGRIVQERITALQDGVKLQHRCGHQIGPAQNVNRQAFGGGEQMVVGGDDAARKIARRVEHAGASGVEQGVGHLAAHAFETLVENRQLHAIQG